MNPTDRTADHLDELPGPVDSDVGLSTPIAGLGPHGERAAQPAILRLSPDDLERAKAAHFTVGVALHTTSSDWARQQLAGIEATLGTVNAALVAVEDCHFDVDSQSAALARLVERRPDAIISIPIGNAAASAAHRAVMRAGITLVLMDNAPTGLLAGRDYVSVVSADNFGLGEVAARSLARYIPTGGTAGIVAYRLDFFATNERELAFTKWFREHRPDAELVKVDFDDPATAGFEVIDGIASRPEMNGLFVVWDVPAMGVIAALHERGLVLPVMTTDLGNAAAIELARGGMIKGIGAQQPYDQGAAEVIVAVLALLGWEPPPWVALPAVAVTRDNVLQAYRATWHGPPPPELIAARRDPGVGER